MDLQNLDSVAAANEGFEGELLHPGNGAPLGVFITVLGRDSDEYQRRISVQNRKRLSRTKGAGQFTLPTVEELRQDTVELLAACTTAWRDEGEQLQDQIKVDGEVYACTYQNVVKVYAQFPWIREQVDNWTADRSNFLKASSKS